MNIENIAFRLMHELMRAEKDTCIIGDITVGEVAAITIFAGGAMGVCPLCGSKGFADNACTLCDMHSMLLGRGRK